MTTRYAIDFDLLPGIVSQQGRLFLSHCLHHGAQYLADVYNLFCRMNGEHARYDCDQFRLTRCQLDDDRHLLYITLPDESDQVMCSIACAIVYQPATADDVPVLYSVERSPLGTLCLGRMDAGRHLNYGMASLDAAENIALIRKVACRS